MDKICDRNPSKSEVIGRCGGDEKKRMTTQNRKSRTLKNKKISPMSTKSNSIVKVLTCNGKYSVSGSSHTCILEYT